MKHSPGTIEAILTLKAKGLSSRKIAYNLGIGKSTVNDILNRQPFPVKQKVDTSANSLKIAVLDIETAAAKGYFFGRFDQNITQNAIIDEGGQVLVACWKWLGSDEVHKLYMTPDEVANMDDSTVIAELYELYRKADAIIMHNGKKFDHKMLQTRGIFFGYGKVPTIKVIDTLVMAKKLLRLPSNKLDSIGAYFGLGRKIDTGGIELWVKVQEGDLQAMQDMVEYCVQDVELLEAVYLKLQALGTEGFNAGLYFNDNAVRCKSCGSTDVESTGRFVYTAAGKYEEVQCNECGAVHRKKEMKNTKEKRKSLLA